MHVRSQDFYCGGGLKPPRLRPRTEGVNKVRQVWGADVPLPAGVGSGEVAVHHQKYKNWQTVFFWGGAANISLGGLRPPSQCLATSLVLWSLMTVTTSASIMHNAAAEFYFLSMVWGIAPCPSSICS